LVVLGLPHRTALKPRPMSLDLQQDHLVSCTAQKSIFLRSSASTNSHERPVKVPTFNVATRVLPTLRDFRTSSVAPRCRPRIRDPRVLLTLAGLCECASAPADAVALSRRLCNVINHMM
uniref:Integron gene cassette protein n=1 Tax=Heligmosomoides polygyrus TaxID=6339 RepID=A0A183GAW5_HELPZ